MQLETWVPFPLCFHLYFYTSPHLVETMHCSEAEADFRVEHKLSMYKAQSLVHRTKPIQQINKHQNVPKHYVLFMSGTKLWVYHVDVFEETPLQ